MNSQTTYLPALFRPGNTAPTVELPVTEARQWIEFVAYTSKFSDSDIPGTLEQLKGILSSETQPHRIAVILAGVGRCQIRAGYFLEGAATLGKAYDMLDQRRGDEMAFVLLEMASFLGNIDQPDLTLSLLEKIPNLTRHQYLLKMAGYYQLVQQSRVSDLNCAADLSDSARYFEEIEEFSVLAYHYKNIGNVYRKLKDFESTEKHYDMAVEIADRNGYPHIRLAVEHDRGMLRFHQNRFEEAVAILNQVQQAADSIYTRAFTLANIGYLYLHRGDVNPAARNFQKAYNLASENGVFHLLPGTGVYLGICYQKLDQHDLAMNFYEKGYQAANELLQHGFKYSGDRKKAIQGYVSFLKSQPETTITVDVDYSFAIDKTLKEIRTIFQSALFKWITRQTTSNKEAASILGVSPKSYYLIRDRIKHLKNHTPPQAVSQFIQRAGTTRWQALNRSFDETIIHFLYQEYGRNRKELAGKLGVSYANVQQLMARAGRSITPKT